MAKRLTATFLALELRRHVEFKDAKPHISTDPEMEDDEVVVTREVTVQICQDGKAIVHREHGEGASWCLYGLGERDTVEEVVADLRSVMGAAWETTRARIDQQGEQA